MSGKGDHRAEASPAGGRGWSAARWTCVLVIVSIAALRCMVVFAMQPIFDVDPATHQAPFGGLGMPGSLLLDAILLAACGAALLVEAASGRGIDARLCLFALLPLPIVLLHGWSDAGNLFRGATWLAAA